VNVAKPLSAEELRGRFVLLDFWTYCCINCMHILPELKKLEEAFPNELVVIGVHSAKFKGEHASDNIREAIARYEIEHPVVNDANLTVWNRYGVRSWPSLVLIDPTGNVVWAASGERDAEDIKAVIDHGLPYFRANGLLKPAPRPELLSDAKKGATPLRFPGKVLADEAGGRLFVADSNHNRIVISSLDGKLLHVVGNGKVGRDDGTLEAATFNHPQGMALVDDVLYVADTENHMLRKINITGRRVSTIAGVGKKGGPWGRMTPEGRVASRRKPTTATLASPWALLVHEKDLLIAMAGAHQIWKMPLDESRIAPFAGNGLEDIADGGLLPSKPFQLGYSSFAQPSGLATDGTQMYVADSEGSAIRSVPLAGKGKTLTLVGLTGTLFDFGDVDGQGENVRLQHPLGVAWSNGKLFVADTYNNKIKEIDVATRTCRSLAGTGKSGLADAEAGTEALFNEPAGLAVAGGKLYIADTNNHAIRVMDLEPPHRVTTHEIEGLAPPERDRAAPSAEIK
jgi:DNA-binding beta-propeller fold protein YncE